MTQAALTRMWSFLGALLALYVASAWSRSQGGPAIGGDLLFDPRPVIASFYAILFTGPATAVLCGIAILYAQRSGKSGWPERMPLSWMPESDVGKINRSDWATKIYLLFTLLVFVLLPSAGIWHFSKKVLSEGVIYNHAAKNVEDVEHSAPRDALPVIGAKWKSMVMATPLPENGRPNWRLASNIHEAKKAIDPMYNPPHPGDLSKICKENSRSCAGIDWYPVLTSVALLICVLVCWGALVALVFQLKRQAPATKSNEEQS